MFTEEGNNMIFFNEERLFNQRSNNRVDFQLQEFTLPHFHIYITETAFVGDRSSIGRSFSIIHQNLEKIRFRYILNNFPKNGNLRRCQRVPSSHF
jgi:hypothetical protein